jgi:hypothetical protein
MAHLLKLETNNDYSFILSYNFKLDTAKLGTEIRQII